MPDNRLRPVEIPAAAQYILKKLKLAGYEAYAVGGCVRDSLLGRIPGDWDICTSALPEETTALFSENPVIETGIKHGTVTVLVEKIPLEVTTFRQDGTYQDHRKPEQVQFVRTLQEDLSRRDFTINAMALRSDGTIVDLFHGQQDLENGCIRCVGVPRQRFDEDALRILRGLRFASTLGFSIHPDTAEAMAYSSALLPQISGERIFQELTKLLLGSDAARVLLTYGDILSFVLPELRPMLHSDTCPELWNKTLRSLSLAPREPVIRWALLLCDAGISSVGHRNSQSEVSAALAYDILSRLKTDKRTRTQVCALIQNCSVPVVPDRSSARHHVASFGPQLSMQLLEFRRCRLLADTTAPSGSLDALVALTQQVQQVLSEPPCRTCRDLAINGQDVMALGIPGGPEVGKLLQCLLEDVLAERCLNQRQPLLERLHMYVTGKD